MFLFCLVFAIFCARLFICALWSPAGKGLTSWLSFVVSSVSLSLSHWYPGSGVVLDCIDSWSLQPYYYETEEGGHEASTEDTFNVVLIVLQWRQRRITPMMGKVTPSGWWGMRRRRGDMRLPLRIPLMLYLLGYRGDRGGSLLWWGKSLHVGDEGWDGGGGHEATTEDTFNVVLIVLQWRQRRITPMMRKVTPSGWWGMRQRRGDMRLPLRIPLMLCLLCYRGDRGGSLLWWGKSLHLGDEGWDRGGGTWGYHWGYL